MELQARKPSSGTGKSQKLSLEYYIRFIDSNKQFDLTCQFLREIIGMHGFKKGCGVKKVLIEMVNSIELMDPTRSTLNDENISSLAFLSLDEAIKDLGDLKWQECCVTSIQIVNPENYDSVKQKADASPLKLKQKRPRKLRKLVEPGESAGDEMAAAIGVGSSQSEARQA